MICKAFEDFILDDLDGRLAPEQKPPLANHLAECPACRAFLFAQVELDQVLTRSIRAELPPDFAANVLRQARRPPRITATLPFEALSNHAGVLAVAAAGAFATERLVPHLVPGLPWAIAVLIFSTGWVVVSEFASSDPD